jgi:dUTPase
MICELGNRALRQAQKKIVDIKDTGYLLVQPGDFAIVTVLEELHLGPRYAGRFGLRSKYARKGIIATTGPQVDPGFRGRLMLGLTNLTPKPISIPYKDDFVSIEFHRLEQATTKPYDGPYQGKLRLGAEEIEAITETEGMAFSEVITTLRSLSQNVAVLTSDFKTLKTWVPTMLVIGFGVLTVIVTVFGILVALKH